MEISIRITLKDKATSQINKVESQITQLDLSNIKKQNPKILGENIIQLCKELEEKYNVTYRVKGLNTNLLFNFDGLQTIKVLPQPNGFNWDMPTKSQQSGHNIYMGINLASHVNDTKYTVVLMEKMPDNTINVFVNYQFDRLQFKEDDRENFNREIQRFKDYYHIPDSNIKFNK